MSTNISSSQTLHIPETFPAAVTENVTVQSGSTAAVSAVRPQNVNNVAGIRDLLLNMLEVHMLEERAVAPPGAPAEQVQQVEQANKVARESNQELRDICQARAVPLDAMGETPQTIENALANAAKMDSFASAGAAAVRGTPFAAASVLQYVYPQINKGEWLASSLKGLKPFISGGLSGLLDQVGTGVMNDMTGDIHYLKAPIEKLHDALANSVRAKAPDMTTSMKDAALNIQTYTARNMVRTVVGTAMAGSPHKALVDTSIAAVGGLVANAGFSAGQERAQKRDRQQGGEFIFGLKDDGNKPLEEETDWRDAYIAARDATPAGAFGRGAKRLALGVPDAVWNLPGSLRGLFSAPSLVQNGVALAGGFAGVGKVQEAVNVALKDAPEGSREFSSQLTNTALSSAVFAGWTAASIGTQAVVDAADKWGKTQFRPHPVSAVVDASKTGGKAARDLAAQVLQKSGSLAAATGNRFRDGIPALRRRNVQEDLEAQRNDAMELQTPNQPQPS